VQFTLFGVRGRSPALSTAFAQAMAKVPVRRAKRNAPPMGADGLQARHAVIGLAVKEARSNAPRPL
jgi:hypothetical protein